MLLSYFSVDLYCWACSLPLLTGGFPSETALEKTRLLALEMASGSGMGHVSTFSSSTPYSVGPVLAALVCGEFTCT